MLQYYILCFKDHHFVFSGALGNLWQSFLCSSPSSSSLPWYTQQVRLWNMVLWYILTLIHRKKVLKNYLQQRNSKLEIVYQFPLSWLEKRWNKSWEIDWGPAWNLVLSFKFQFGTCTKIRIANQRCFEKFDNYKIWIPPREPNQLHVVGKILQSVNFSVTWVTRAPVAPQLCFSYRRKLSLLNTLFFS